MKASALGVLFLFLAPLAAQAKCPYHALWMPNSPYKLPSDHPAMLAYTETTATRRRLAQASNSTSSSSSSSSADRFKGKGVGTCKYTNPFTQSETCVQMTGSAYAEDEEEAKAWCAAPGLPGAVGTFEAGATCEAFEDENFGGVCVTGDGTPEETAAAFVEVPGNALASCATTIMGCTTFGGGKWYTAGGKCVADENDEAMKSTIAAPEGADLAEGECKLQAGIAGGGHMDMDAFWTSSCANSNSSYSVPRRWHADTKTITTQKAGTVTVGHVWYDLENNRRREDSFLQEGELNIFQEARNSTFLHFGPTMYLIDWNEDGTTKCTIVPSPVGILRPNWIIDSEGYDAVSQYLGTEYMMYEGKYRRVKKFRKTEPLEDAYMIQSFDDEGDWNTPEGPKKRPLNRQTPGAPFQGDAVNMYFNHSTDFSDDVFEIYKTMDCQDREFNRSEFAERQAELAEQNGVEFDATAPGLNLNSSFHVDSSVLDLQCEECDITYAVRSTDETGTSSADLGKEEEPAQAASKPSLDPPGESATKDFEGGEEVNKEVSFQWKFHSENSTLSIIATLAKEAWFSVAFPEVECQMAPAESVIALPAEGSAEVQGNRYSIDSHAMSGVQEMLGEENFGSIPSFSTSRSSDGSKIVIEVERYVPDFSAPLSVTWARGFDTKLGYHGGDGKGCIAIKVPNTQ